MRMLTSAHEKDLLQWNYESFSLFCLFLVFSINLPFHGTYPSLLLKHLFFAIICIIIIFLIVF